MVPMMMAAVLDFMAHQNKRRGHYTLSGGTREKEINESETKVMLLPLNHPQKAIIRIVSSARVHGKR